MLFYVDGDGAGALDELSQIIFEAFRRFLAALLLMGGVGGGAAIAQTVDAGDAALMESLIKQLGGDDLGAREKAQKALESISYRQLDLVQKYADKAADPETKARLSAVVGSIEEIAATTAPPLSLELKDASLAEVGAALSREMKTPVDFSGAVRAQSADRFTLSAVDQPLWEVMRQLSKQHPIWITNDPPMLVQQPEGRGINAYVTRGLAVTVGDASVVSNGIVVQIAAAIDPRIAVMDLHAMQIEDARDDQGHLLHLEVEPVADRLLERKRLELNAPVLQHFQSKTARFGTDGPLGKAVTIRGAIKFLVQISQATVDVGNAGAHVNEPTALGDSKVTYGGLTGKAAGAPANGRALLQLQIVPNDSAVDAPVAPSVEITDTGFSMRGSIGGRSGSRVIIDSEGTGGGNFLGTAATASDVTRVLVTDATGKVVAKYTIPRGLPVTSLHVIAAGYQEPLKFSFSIPTKTREVSIPFEFKNVPIMK